MSCEHKTLNPFFYAEFNGRKEEFTATDMVVATRCTDCDTDIPYPHMLELVKSGSELEQPDPDEAVTGGPVDIIQTLMGPMSASEIEQAAYLLAKRMTAISSHGKAQIAERFVRAYEFLVPQPKESAGKPGAEQASEVQ